MFSSTSKSLSSLWLKSSAPLRVAICCLVLLPNCGLLDPISSYYDRPVPYPNPVFTFGDWISVSGNNGLLISTAMNTGDEWQYLGKLPVEDEYQDGFYLRDFDIVYGTGYWALLATGNNNINRRRLRIAKDPRGAFFPSSDSDTNHGTNLEYGAGRWVIVGDYCQIATSDDVTGSWQKNRFNSDKLNHRGCSLLDVSYGDDYWVAVGILLAEDSNAVEGLIMTSDDPAGPWQEHLFSDTGQLYGVAYGNGIWIVVGEQGTILTSGATEWIWQRVNSPTTKQLRSVKYGDGHWVAVGGKEADCKEEPSTVILTSADPAHSWSLAQIEKSDVNEGCPFLAVEYGDGLWIASGDSGLARSATDPTASWKPLSGVGIRLEYRQD